MTKHELVTRYLDQIRGGLDIIEELLEPEPEGLAASVLRLTDTCNELELENAVLRNDLTQYRAGWCPYDCATVEELAKLRAKIAEQNKYIELLKKSRRLAWRAAYAQGDPR